MNGRQLADRIGNIDDRLIQQAQETGQKKSAGRKLIFSALAAAPLFEEIFFRKALCGVLRTQCGVIPAALITAVVFAAMHFNWQQLPGLMFFSLVWQWCYYRSQSLLTAVILHFFNNLFSVAMLWAVRCWGNGMDI